MSLKTWIMLALTTVILIACDKVLSTSPPETEPPKAKIKISSNPEGYSIYLDNKISGLVTPDSFSFLDYTEHIIELRHSIYLDTTISVLTLNDTTENLHIDMSLRDEFYGKIETTSYPSNAAIVLNDSLINLETPVIIEGLYPGNYTLSFIRQGYRSKEYTLLVKSNQTSACHGTLEDTTIWLVYNTSNSALTTNATTCVEVDIQNTNDVWIGTSDAGVFRLNNSGFSHFDIDNSNLPSNFAQSITINYEGQIYVSSPYGAGFYDGLSWIKFTPNGEFNLNMVNSIEIENDFSYQTGVGHIRNYICHFSTMGEGIVTLQDGSYHQYDLGNYSLDTKFISSTLHLTNGLCIATNDRGLYLLETTRYNSRWSHFDGTNTSFLVKEDGSCKINAIAAKPGTSDLYISNNFAPFVSQFFYSPQTEYGEERRWIEVDLGYAKVNQILLAQGKVWLATYNGLFVLENDTEITAHYTTSNSGLPTNNIYGIAQDRALNIWLATGNGLVRFNPNL